MDDTSPGEVREVEPEQASGGGNVSTRRYTRRRIVPNKDEITKDLVGSSLSGLEFIAYLCTSRDPIKLGKDGEMKLSIEVPAEEMAKALPIITFRNACFRVRIEPLNV